MWWRWGWVLVLASTVSLPVSASDATRNSPATVVIEAASGELLAEQGADDLRDPGSFSQLMVLLLALERSSLENLPLDVPVGISASTEVPPAVRAREVVTLRADQPYLLSDLMKATLVSAAQTAAVGVAEAIAGTLPLCVDAMNQRAALLGMTSSHFGGIGSVRVEPGVTDRTTARDLALLARALVSHPQVLAWSSLTGLPFDHGTVLLRNANSMVGAVRGVDGLQVSAVDGRFGVIATAQRGAMRLITVVLDSPESGSAYRAATHLLETGFADYDRVDIVRGGERLKISVNVEGGTAANIVPVVAEPFSVLRRRTEERRLTLRYQLPDVLFAPVREHDRVGEIIAEERGRVVAVIPLLSPTDVPRSGLLSVASR